MKVATICKNRKTLVVTSPLIKKLYFSLIETVLPFEIDWLLIEGGEQAKSLDSLVNIWEYMARNGFDRSSIVIVIEGGSVGDMVGFAASTYMRGIDWINIPTTLLAQVDSSIGGKTSINIPAGKNLVGSFHLPLITICDFDFLSSLDIVELKQGLVEIVKIAWVYNLQLFDYLKCNIEKIDDVKDPIVLENLAGDAIRSKVSIISKDFKDVSGLRAILNFGHTLAHALEASTDYSIRHGDAVLVGMLFDLGLSVRYDKLTTTCAKELVNIIEKIGLPELKGVDIETITSLMAKDKKNTGNLISFITTSEKGKAGVKLLPINEVERLVREFFLDPLKFALINY